MRREGGVFTSLLSTPVSTLGWERDEYYEVRVRHSAEGTTSVSVVGWRTGDTQTLFIDDAAAATRGRFGVYCGGAADCVFDRAYAYRLNVAAQLSAARNCEACENNLVAQLIGTASWCRCCGEGGKI